MEWKSKILADAKKQLNDFKESNQWLHDAARFNPGLYLEGNTKSRAYQLFTDLQLGEGYKIEQKQKDFDILIANLIDQRRKPIKITQNRNDWKRNKYQISSYYTIDLVKRLYNEKMIQMKTGYHTAKNRRMTRIFATENLLRLFPPSDHSEVRYKAVEVVELWEKKKTQEINPATNRKHSVKTKRLIDYKDTIETNRIREILIRTNQINDKADIQFTAGKSTYKLNAAIKAKFTNKFTLGGRLYSEGRSQFQGLSKQERKDITINGSPVVEIDYTSLHPLLLYAAEGIQYFGDPYLAVDQRKEIRPFLKRILLCMINNPNYSEAQSAANNWLVNESDKETREKIIREGITKAAPLMDRFLEIHQPIRKYLCTKSTNGLRLMNQDAKIAVDVVNHFSRQGIPILCIHDSFLVAEQYKQELKTVMKRIYKKHTGMRISVK